MVGVLSGQHTMLVLMAKGTFRAGHVSLPWGEGTIDLALYALNRPKRSWSRGRFGCEVFLEADLEDPTRLDVDARELIDAVQGYLAAEMDRVFRATAWAGADVFGVGREAIRTFHSWEEWAAFGSTGWLRDVEATFTVRVKLSHSPHDPALE